MPPTKKPGRKKQAAPVPFDRRLLFAAFVSGAPAVIVSVAILWTGDYTPKVQWTLSLFVLGFWVFGCLAVRERIVRPLQTISNLLAALREGDFSIRARGAAGGDPLSEVNREVNALGGILREQRLVAMEATALLRTVMAEIDVAIFAFDDAGLLKLVNRTCQELIAQPAERLMGRDAVQLGLGECLEGEPTRVLPINFPGGQGRWGMRRTTFREGGLSHNLIVIADLSRPLRDEELKAWQRLVRVLGHELNNSLAPIKSLAGSLRRILKQRGAEWEEDTERGLDIIAARAEGLSRFMEAYARLARLPPPSLAEAEIGSIVRRVVALEARVQVNLVTGPEVVLKIDPAQIEQLLINALKNAAEAVLESGGGVSVDWAIVRNFVEVRIHDEGPGIANPSNLFVPFFTTKPGGTGIGLVLCRQVAENHGGSFTLVNRTDRSGCEALLRLPLVTAGISVRG